MKVQLTTIPSATAAANAPSTKDMSVETWLEHWRASGETREWIAHKLDHSSTEMLFRIYSRFVPNLTRQDGSAIDRLLVSRFAGSNPQAPAAPRAADAKSDATPPNAQPPPAFEREALAMT